MTIETERRWHKGEERSRCDGGYLWRAWYSLFLMLFCPSLERLFRGQVFLEQPMKTTPKLLIYLALTFWALCAHPNLPRARYWTTEDSPDALELTKLFKPANSKLHLAYIRCISYAPACCYLVSRHNQQCGPARQPSFL